LGVADRDEWNRQVIEEFRANSGRVGGNFEGAPMILIHHKGRSSGTERINPVVYLPVDGGYAVFASKAGAPDHPDWYLNLVANPETTVEVGADTIAVTARDTSGEERDRLYAQQVQVMPGFAEYEVNAAPRVIPVVVFEPRS
jgi:deazaflavin-dependent oxidoreductase (nitroreductase family)